MRNDITGLPRLGRIASPIKQVESKWEQIQQSSLITVLIYICCFARGKLLTQPTHVLLRWAFGPKTSFILSQPQPSRRRVLYELPYARNFMKRFTEKQMG